MPNTQQQLGRKTSSTIDSNNKTMMNTKQYTRTAQQRRTTSAACGSSSGSSSGNCRTTRNNNEDLLAEIRSRLRCYSQLMEEFSSPSLLKTCNGTCRHSEAEGFWRLRFVPGPRDTRASERDIAILWDTSSSSKRKSTVASNTNTNTNNSRSQQQQQQQQQQPPENLLRYLLMKEELLGWVAQLQEANLARSSTAATSQQPPKMKAKITKAFAIEDYRRDGTNDNKLLDMSGFVANLICLDNECLLRKILKECCGVDLYGVHEYEGWRVRLLSQSEDESEGGEDDPVVVSENESGTSDAASKPAARRASDNNSNTTATAAAQLSTDTVNHKKPKVHAPPAVGVQSTEKNRPGNQKDTVSTKSSSVTTKKNASNACIQSLRPATVSHTTLAIVAPLRVPLPALEVTSESDHTDDEDNKEGDDHNNNSNGDEDDDDENDNDTKVSCSAAKEAQGNNKGKENVTKNDAISAPPYTENATGADLFTSNKCVAEVAQHEDAEQRQPVQQLSSVHEQQERLQSDGETKNALEKKLPVAVTGESPLAKLLDPNNEKHCTRQNASSSSSPSDRESTSSSPPGGGTGAQNAISPSLDEGKSDKEIAESSEKIGGTIPAADDHSSANRGTKHRLRGFSGRVNVVVAGARVLRLSVDVPTGPVQPLPLHFDNATMKNEAPGMTTRSSERKTSGHEHTVHNEETCGIATRSRDRKKVPSGEIDSSSESKHCSSNEETRGMTTRSRDKAGERARTKRPFSLSSTETSRRASSQDLRVCNVRISVQGMEPMQLEAEIVPDQGIPKKRKLSEAEQASSTPETAPRYSFRERKPRIYFDDETYDVPLNASKSSLSPVELHDDTFEEATANERTSSEDDDVNKTPFVLSTSNTLSMLKLVQEYEEVCKRRGSCIPLGNFRKADDGGKEAVESLLDELEDLGRKCPIPEEDDEEIVEEQQVHNRAMKLMQGRRSQEQLVRNKEKEEAENLANQIIQQQWLNQKKWKRTVEDLEWDGIKERKIEFEGAKPRRAKRGADSNQCPCSTASPDDETPSCRLCHNAGAAGDSDYVPDKNMVPLFRRIDVDDIVEDDDDAGDNGATKQDENKIATRGSRRMKYDPAKRRETMMKVSEIRYSMDFIEDYNSGRGLLPEMSK